MQTLTDKQRKVLEFIKARIAQKLPPTIREIGRALGFSSTGTVRDYLKALQQKGYLKRPGRLSRAIELAEEAFSIPIISRIAAGSPALAYEDIEGHINPDDLFLGRLSQADVFAVKVKGVSMTGAGILDGDIAIIKKQAHANNGDVVAALLEDNEVTLKIFRQKAGIAFLEPANPAYKPIHKDFSVIGKLITVIRKY